MTKFETLDRRSILKRYNNSIEYLAIRDDGVIFQAPEEKSLAGHKLLLITQDGAYAEEGFSFGGKDKITVGRYDLLNILYYVVIRFIMCGDLNKDEIKSLSKLVDKLNADHYNDYKGK